MISKAQKKTFNIFRLLFFYFACSTTGLRGILHLFRCTCSFFLFVFVVVPTAKTLDSRALIREEEHTPREYLYKRYITVITVTALFYFIFMLFYVILFYCRDINLRVHPRRTICEGLHHKVADRAGVRATGRIKTEGYFDKIILQVPVYCLRAADNAGGASICLKIFC